MRKEYLEALENIKSLLKDEQMKKFTICVHDIVTYWDIEAESETEAIEQALDMWIDRRPRCEVTEQKD